MIKDAVKPFREPVAWVMVGAVFVQFVVGIWSLLEKTSDFEESWFIYNSYSGAYYFIQLLVPVLLLTALVAVAWPESHARAKLIALVVLVEGSVMAFFGLLTTIVGAFYSSDESYAPKGGEKARQFFGQLVELAAFLVPLLVAIAMLRALSSRPAAAQQFVAGPQQQGGYYAAPPQQQYPQQYPPQPYPQQQYPPQPQQPNPWGGGYGQGGW